jgi:hypothetical protein
MFDSISIQLKNDSPTGSVEQSIDFGLIAEAMLFYQKVHVIASHGFLEALIRRFHPDVFLQYLNNGYLQVSYLENGTGIKTDNTGTAHERHQPVIFTIPDYAWEKYSRKLIKKATGLKGKEASRYDRELRRHVVPLAYERSVEEDTIQDFAEAEYVSEAVRGYLATVAPEYSLPSDYFFKVHRDADRLAVETNIDFVVANNSYHKRVSPKHSSLNPAYLLSNLMQVRGEWHFASKLNSEMAADRLRSRIVELKFGELLASRTKSDAELSLFQDFVFEDSRAVGDTIRLNNRSFADLLKVLDDGAKFKEWLRDKDVDDGLLREYIRSISGRSWIDELPPKTLRWAIFQAAGLGVDALGGAGLGTAMAMAVGASDTFLLDRLVKGWRPNQFIDEVKEFIPEKSLGQLLKDS